MEITPENVAKAVDGFVDRDGSIICSLPDSRDRPRPHAVAGAVDHRHAPHPGALPVARLRQEALPRNQGGPRRRGLPADKIGATRKPQEFPAWDYYTADGKYSWTKQKKVSASGRKRFICGRWDHQANDWIELKRPADAVKLFNLQTIAQALAAAPEHPLLIVEGEKDVITAAELGALAVTNADGAGKWTAEDTRTLIGLGARKVVVCPDNDAPGIDHGVRVAKFFQSAGVETRWLELPGLGAKEDLSDWAPEAGRPRRAPRRADRRRAALRRRGARLAQPPESGGAERRLHLSRRRAQPDAGARIRTAPQGLLRLERLSPPDRGHPQDAVVPTGMVGARRA